MTKTRDLADLGGGFIHSGTGTVRRRVEDKLADVVSVRDFGAVGDGTTDDATAIQNAINYCQDNDLTLEFVTGKRYRINSTLTWKHGRSSSDPKAYYVRVKGNNATLYPANSATAMNLAVHWQIKVLVEVRLM